MYTKDKLHYEQLIRNSLYFLPDQQTEPINKKTEKSKLIENVFKYLLAVNEKKYSPYGLEIMETAIKCLKYYDYTQGDFFCYFNKVFKKDFQIIKAKENIINSKGNITISENDKFKLNCLKKYFDSKNIRYLNDEIIENASKVLEIEKHKIEELWALEFMKISSSNEKNSSGEEYDLIVDIKDKEKDILTIIEEVDDVKLLLKKIDIVYLGKRASQKRALSKIITSKILPILDDKEMVVFVSKLNFFDVEIYGEYKKKGKTVTTREISTQLNICEQSASRIYSSFLDSLKKEI